MNHGYLIGLDYGTQSARGVLVNAETGEVEASHAYPYRHGVMTDALPDGTPLAPNWALQNAADYTEAAETILSAIGRDKTVHGIGIGFTASSPLPATEDGIPLSELHPDEPHAYVKLWKHQAAQRWAEKFNSQGGAYLQNVGGRLSAEWLIAKAAQLKDEAPILWSEADRFIESGDWLVWSLTGQERRSMGFATYKAQFDPAKGYPDVVPGLLSKLSTPLPIGESAGSLTPAWRERTGIQGDAKVAVAVIDSHVVMPAASAVEAGTLVGALGTSAAFMLLDDAQHTLPAGIEGVAKDGVLPGFWCYEAGQAGFGDTLEWFMRTFAPAEPLDAAFERYTDLAGRLRPGENHLIALDWWNGCRVPHGDSSLSGLLVGLNLKTTAVDIYRALLESLCFGTRNIVECFVQAQVPVQRIVLTSGLAQRNTLLMQLMADVLNRNVEVPVINHATAVSAAIHGAVAAKVVANYSEGSSRFGAQSVVTYYPNQKNAEIYQCAYQKYREMSNADVVLNTMHGLD